jgi:hypothetical protein
MRRSMRCSVYEIVLEKVGRKDLETGASSGPLGTEAQGSCAGGPFKGPAVHKILIGTPESLNWPFLAK